MNIAIIPARANSKSILNKNLQKVGGISLLGHAIQAAQQAKLFDRIIVTTDGKEIKQEAMRFGAEVIDRPPELSTDTAKSIDSVLHVLTTLGVSLGVSVLLQPTSPLRTDKHIKEAYSNFIKDQFTNSLISITEADIHPYKMLLRSEDQFLPLSDIKYMEYPRQDLPKAYQINGAIYVNKIDKLINNRNFFIEPIVYYEMDQESSVDIDYPEDLNAANNIYSLRMQDK